MSPIEVGTHPLTVEDVVAIAVRKKTVALTHDRPSLQRMERSVAVVQEHLAREGRMYGVTTGFGDSCETQVQGALLHSLPDHLVRFHGCGTGALFNPTETRAILIARLVSLSRGYSGVRQVVLERLAELLNRDVLPNIPSEGSVGASGDLTPLSYVAAVLCGERDVFFEHQNLPAIDVLKRLSLPALELGPKESLALMNGTSVMTGLACLVAHGSQRLLRWGAALTAVAADVLQASPSHFDPRIFELKPHPGQTQAALWIRDDIEYATRANVEPKRLQDRYSIRCAPHVLGVLADTLAAARPWIETELNSVNDNPIVDPESGDVLHGGNFYGGHMAQAMDMLKTALANVADLVERQLVLLCQPHTNNGLPANLVGAPAEEAPAHHGFKAMQITASALTAEALKLTMPASVFSRSTENHNQDKVSMGTIAARDCVRVIELVETVCAIHLLALMQAVDLRGKKGCHKRALELHQCVRNHVPKHTQDRAMDRDIQQMLALWRSESLPVGEGA